MGSCGGGQLTSYSTSSVPLALNFLLYCADRGSETQGFLAARRRGMQEHPGERTTTQHAVFVSRQAIYTPQLEVMAYTLDFHSGVAPQGEREPGYQTLAQGLLTSFLEIGLDALVGPTPACLPVTRGVLLLGYVDAFPPDRVVLALPATVTVDDGLGEGLRAIAARGYA